MVMVTCFLVITSAGLQLSAFTQNGSIETTTVNICSATIRFYITVGFIWSFEMVTVQLSNYSYT